MAFRRLRLSLNMDFFRNDLLLFVTQKGGMVVSDDQKTGYLHGLSLFDEQRDAASDESLGFGRLRSF